MRLALVNEGDDRPAPGLLDRSPRRDPALSELVPVPACRIEHHLIYDVTQAEGTDVIVMQYVSGKTLRELLRLRPGSSGGVSLKLSEALGYAIQMADALAAAHSHGIVHRDLKPENVMVTEDGRVKNRQENSAQTEWLKVNLQVCGRACGCDLPLRG